MSLLAGGQDLSSAAGLGRLNKAWLLAFSVALSLHLAVAAYFLCQPVAPKSERVSAAPMAFAVNMVAAPKSPQSDLPIAPLQDERAASAESKKAKPKPQKQPAPTPPVPQQKIKLDEGKSQLRLQKQLEQSPKKQPSEQAPPKTPKKPEPAEQIAPTKALQQEPPPEQKPDQQQEQKPEQQTEDAPPAERDAKAQQAAQSAAPLALDSQEAEQVSAPNIGALQEQQAQLTAAWQQQVQAYLERRKRYPRSARMRQQQGVPQVRFSINREGQVLAVSLYRSSGVKALDREVLALVKRAQPLPKPPEDVPDGKLTMVVPVSFFLR